MACPESSIKMEDLISNLPDIVIDKILEKLPIRKAAQTSVLSKQWSHTWLSLKSLIFDYNFSQQHRKLDGFPNWYKCSRVISNILLHHNGPVHDFYLHIPYTEYGDHLTHSQWISFLSKNGVRKMVIINDGDTMDLTSYIFRCSELAHLELKNLNLNPPPTDFIGFPYLKHLELVQIYLTKQNIFYSLIESCKMLTTLKLEDCSGMVHIVIDAPRLQTLILKGYFESLAFENVLSLKSISMDLTKMPKKLVTVETIDAVNLLASPSHQLQTVQFDGYLCKVIRGENVQHIHEFNYNYKLNHLLEITIKGIRGSTSELKLVEYVLAISVSLENMFLKSGYCGITQSELKMEMNMLRALMRFPRASPKSSLVYLDI